MSVALLPFISVCGLVSVGVDSDLDDGLVLEPGVLEVFHTVLVHIFGSIEHRFFELTSCRLKFRFGQTSAESPFF